jgi:hypothetical protein
MLDLPAPQPWLEPHRRRWVRRRCEPRAAPCDREAQLVGLARGSGALRRALARVAGRIVAMRGWEQLGLARLEDYATERAGISPRELRDLAHVDRALAKLPEIDAALRSGAIGWTQARLLCRVAEPDDQRAWLRVAARLPARALAREVRAFDRCSDAAATLRESDERVGVVVHCTPAARAQWWHARQIANRVAGHALSHEAFAEALAAEVWSALPLDAASGDAKRVPDHAGSSDRACAPAGSPVSPGAERPMPPFAAWLERDLDRADAFELDARLRRGSRLEAQRLARVAALLESTVASGRHRSLDAYAEEHLDMAPSRARALLRIARASRRCPELGAAFGSGRISWVQAHAIVPVLFEPGAERHRAAWVARAARVTVRRLRDDVEAALASGAFAPEGDLQTGAIARPRAASIRLFFAAAPEVAHLFRAALATLQRRLACSQSEALEAMLAHAVATWQPENQRRQDAIFERDGWRCTVPGCSSYRNLHAHHISFRSAGGSDDPTNLTTLCAWHHLRGVHAGVVRCTGAAPDALRFELPVITYGPGEVIMA